jgi:kynureninase
MKTETIAFANDLDFARQMDASDPLRKYRFEFSFPQCGERKEAIYFAGNSLGLAPLNARKYINEELDDWGFLGVEGHFESRHPWLPYHEFVTDMLARLVGAQANEVVAMNSLTVNLHLMLVSFYQPTKERYKILIESDAFPSDRYAVHSQAEFHGYNAKEAVLQLKPKPGEDTLATEDIISFIEENGKEIALILLGNVNYLSGQAFDLKKIAEAAHKQGCIFGTNLAPGAGNLVLNLHNDEVDFAVWCSYKYLNSGPGGIAGCFVHEKYEKDFQRPRFAGWWGHNKETRFQMGPDFDPLPGAEGWQLSNPPIFQLAALRASLEYFDVIGMPELRAKSELLTGYLEFLLTALPNNFCTIITPKDSRQRGAQLSVRVKGEPKDVLSKLKDKGALCDFRAPDIIRAAPAPLYCSFADVYEFAQLIGSLA